MGDLLKLTERTIHRAERGAQLEVRIRLGLKLLQARMSSGKAVLAPEKRVVERIHRPRNPVVNESGAKYGQSWHGQLRTGVDVRPGVKRKDCTLRNSWNYWA